MSTQIISTPKSPFFVVQNFASMLTCERVVENLNLNIPTVDPYTKKIVRTRVPDQRSVNLLQDLFDDYHADMNNHYRTELNVEDEIDGWFEWFPEGTDSTPASLDTHRLDSRRWVKTSMVDFYAYVFLSEYNSKPPFDSDFEVYGGKLEFPTFRMGFNPQIGTLVAFPAAPNFMHGFSAIWVGELIVARLSLTSRVPYVYDSKAFSTNTAHWFNQ